MKLFKLKEFKCLRSLSPEMKHREKAVCLEMALGCHLLLSLYGQMPLQPCCKAIWIDSCNGRDWPVITRKAHNADPS